jgi:hypothetical protein
MNRGAHDKHDAPASCPPAVRFGCVLLSVQAGLWALASLGALAVFTDPVNWKRAAAHGTGQLAWYITASVAAVALPAGLSAASIFLARHLERGGSKARITAVGLEAAMTCFGMLIAWYTASAGAGIVAVVPVLAGLTGSALSLTAATALLGRKARTFAQLSHLSLRLPRADGQ